MFTKITLNNFRSFDNIVFDLTPKSTSETHLAIIYGANGSGKSNLVSAFVLLSELLDTLNVRDVYEEILNQKSIFSDENMDKAMKQRLVAGLRDIGAIIDDYRMVGNDSPIIAEFEFDIGNKKGKYHIELGEKEIIYEKLEYTLNKRCGVYYECSADGIYVNNSIITDNDFLADIKSSAKRFWGKHSILSIVLHEIRDKSNTYGRSNLSENFSQLLDEFYMLSCHVDIGKRRWNHLNGPIEILNDAREGRIPKSLEKQLEFAEHIFSHVFTAANPNIKNVYYKKNYSDKYVDYELYFEKIIANQRRSIPFSKESSGNHQLLDVLCYILNACIGGVVIFDEADTGIHDILFKKLIIEAQPLIHGQFIITTHNTLLMETDFARESVFILDEDINGHKTIKNVKNAYEKRTFANNNIRNKYLNFEYGGIPQVASFDFSALIDVFESEIDRLLND